MVEVAPSAIIGQFTIDFGLGVAAGSRVFIRANYPGPIGIPDAGLNSEWLLYTRSVMWADIRYDGDAGSSLVVQTASIAVGGVPNLIDSMPFHIPPNNYPFKISGLELSGMLAKFYIVAEVGNANDVVRGTIIVRGL